MFSDIGIGFCRDAIGKIRRLQQLSRIVLPAVHQKRDIFLIPLKDIISISTRESGGILIIERKKQAVNCCTSS